MLRIDSHVIPTRTVCSVTDHLAVHTFIWFISSYFGSPPVTYVPVITTVGLLRSLIDLFSQFLRLVRYVLSFYVRILPVLYSLRSCYCTLYLRCGLRLTLPGYVPSYVPTTHSSPYDLQFHFTRAVPAPRCVALPYVPTALVATCVSFLLTFILRTRSLPFTHVWLITVCQFARLVYLLPYVTVCRIHFTFFAALRSPPRSLPS